MAIFFCAMPFADTRKIVLEGDGQHPVQRIFYLPVRSNGQQKALRYAPLMRGKVFNLRKMLKQALCPRFLKAFHNTALPSRVTVNHTLLPLGIPR